MTVVYDNKMTIQRVTILSSMEEMRSAIKKLYPESIVVFSFDTGTLEIIGEDAVQASLILMRGYVNYNGYKILELDANQLEDNIKKFCIAGNKVVFYEQPLQDFLDEVYHKECRVCGIVPAKGGGIRNCKHKEKCPNQIKVLNSQSQTKK